MKTDLFQFCGHCWVFQICWHIEWSTFTVSTFKILNSSTRISSHPLALSLVMLLKAHLTSHAKMSGSRWVITPSWLSGSLRSFLDSSVYSCHPFLIFSTSVRFIPFLSFIVPIFAYFSFHVSNFLREIDNLSHSIVFLYFFSLITYEGFLISPYYSLELCIHMDITFLFSFAFHFSFSAICKASSDNHFAFLHFIFLGMVLTMASWTMLWTSIYSPSGPLSIRSNPLSLFVASTV